MTHLLRCLTCGLQEDDWSHLSSGVVHRGLDQSWDDVLPDGAGERQPGGLGEGSRHAGLQEPEQRPDAGQLLVLPSVLVGEEEEADVQTGSAAAHRQVTGSTVDVRSCGVSVLISFLCKGHDLWLTLT